jgi:hypothetical protein
MALDGLLAMITSVVLAMAMIALHSMQVGSG